LCIWEFVIEPITRLGIDNCLRAEIWTFLWNEEKILGAANRVLFHMKILIYLTQAKINKKDVIVNEPHIEVVFR
jgi:hypothetical protein